MREAAFDSLDGAGEVVGGEEQVDVVGHDDEGVEFEEALGAVVLQGVEEEACVGVDLEEAAAVVGDRGEEEGSGVGGSLRVRHGFSVWAARRKADWSLRLRLHSGLRQSGRAFGPAVYGPAEAVPFRWGVLLEARSGL